MTIGHVGAETRGIGDTDRGPSADRAGTATETAFRPRFLLIATDASENAAGAIRVGLRVAETVGARAELLSVVPPLPTPVAPINPGFVVVPTDEVEYARRNGRLAEITSQVTTVCGRDPGWRVTVSVGDPADVIAQTAAEDGTDLVVVGLRRHGLLDRVFRDETALRVMRRSPVPVLAVTPLLAGLPQRVIAAVDFSRASMRAARLAAQIVAPGGTLLLAHVQAEQAPPTDETEGARLIHAQGVSAAFARLRRDLGAPSSVHVEPVLVRGAAAAELLALADRAEADLIAVGSHRRTPVDRLMLGSVTAALARDARCSLLVTRATG